jgi:general secretion pathway protein F
VAVFEYRALNPKGKKVTGLVDADSLTAARTRLRDQQLFPVSLAQVRSETDLPAGIKGGARSIAGVFSSISASETAVVTRLLATLLSAGFPLVRAVATVAGQTRSRAMQKVLSRVKDAVEEGLSFADALKLFPRVFSPVYVNMVAAGESSGTLEVVLERLADFAEHREETRKKIQAALTYPVIMSVVGFLVLVILMTYIVPGIIEIFSDMNQVLPLPTLILVQVSDFFTRFWWGVLLLPVLGAGGGICDPQNRIRRPVHRPDTDPAPGGRPLDLQTDHGPLCPDPGIFAGKRGAADDRIAGCQKNRRQPGVRRCDPGSRRPGGTGR